MDYGAVRQNDHDSDDGSDVEDRVPQRSYRAPLRTPSFGLFLDNSAHSLNAIVQSITSTSSSGKQSYDMLEEDEFEAVARKSPELSARKEDASPTSETPFYIPRPQRRRGDQATNPDSSSRLRSHESVPRTASGLGLALRHPTPDLQVLKGAYTGNIQHLEKTAERLSMTSSIEDAIKELHDEQKRSDSRRSSLLSLRGEISVVSRQFSNASIVDVNSAARSGGYSPGGVMLSPKSSFSFTNGDGRGRSASRSSKLSRPEPEMEGRPLDAFTGLPTMQSPISPRLSIPELDEETSTLTRAINLVGHDQAEVPNQDEEVQPIPSASEQLEKMFADFDGTHSENLHTENLHTSENQNTRQARSVSGISGGALSNDSEKSHRGLRTMLPGDRLSMASLPPRPQSYMDPSTNQTMVYYPAPVPMMLNLPQKLSKNPSSQLRNKRRSQVLSSVPAAARQSAIWLPDVLEDGEGEPDNDDDSQRQEYMPQHQRASMGGRRLTQDLTHMPPQLRASTYFDLPGPNTVVKLKEQSAVATLDSILDASAHAPVSAFTDHAFAGALGAEVYGKSHVRNSRSITQLSETQPAKKRTSSFNLLRGRRSTSDLLDPEKRKSTLSLKQSAQRSPIEDDDEDDSNDKASTPLRPSEAGHSRNVSGEYAVKPPGDEESDEGQLDDEIYHGPPTTLLAELQLRKQRQKQRTQPLTKTFPNGIHSTLLEMDTVIQTEQKQRKKGRTILAWEDAAVIEARNAATEDDEDVPLAMLFSKKAEDNRPLGLMERRDMEDNEPLSRRRDRLQGKPVQIPHASSTMNLNSNLSSPSLDEQETLAQRVRRMKDTVIPATRPVSGDFASEMMSQFGGDLLSPDAKGKGKIIPASPSPGPEDEETLGQRRKRLQAEREARALEVGTGTAARPGLKTQRSMADILQAHPAAGAERQVGRERPAGGLLGLAEQEKRRSSVTLAAAIPHQNSGGYKAGMYNDGQGAIIPPAQPQQRRSVYSHNPQYSASGSLFPQPSLGMGNLWANPYPINMNMGPAAYGQNHLQYQMGLMQNQMAMMTGQGIGIQPLNQGQIDMVERWRQSVMQ